MCAGFRSIKVFCLIVFLVNVSSSLYIILLSMQCLHSHLESYVLISFYGLVYMGIVPLGYALFGECKKNRKQEISVMEIVEIRIVE